MFLVLAAITIEIDTLLWICGILLGVIGFLVIVVCKHFNDKLSDISKDNRDISDKIDTQRVDLEAKIVATDNKAEAKVVKLHQRIDDERSEREHKHDESVTRIMTELEKNKEKCNDLSETIAGIGAVYVTRGEFNTIAAANRNNVARQ